MAGYSRKEKFHILNELTGLVHCLINRNVLIDLRHDVSVAGKIVSVDGFMNISMQNVVYIDEAGLQYPMEEFTVFPRYLRYIHLPKELDIRNTLEAFIVAQGIPPKVVKKRTFKQKRAQDNQKRTLLEICNRNKE
jgi:small nuclear ribonucleoprotein (snRNP)-like protein